MTGLKNIRYSAPTPLGDYKVAALQTFKTHKGDCYGFFSIAKALLTAAEIENIDVIGTTVDHYWNLINCGEGWYHFDTTAGWNTDRFMWTDEQIANYNYVIPSTGYRLHYAWDQSKYPATPKK